MKSRTHIPPATEEGGLLPLDPMEMDVLYPGVRGYAVRDGETVFIPWILAEKEGSGAVGEMLDSLAPCCVVTNCISARLRGMLERRGWRMSREGEFGADCWRPPLETRP